MRTERALLVVVLGALATACSAPSPAPSGIRSNTAAAAAESTAAAAKTPATPVENATPSGIATTSNAPASNHEAVAQPATPQATVTTKPLEGNGSAQGLPEDVQAFIIKRRMCKHLSAASAEDAGEAKLAMRVCPGADADEWKALVKKYQGQDAITGVLLAERPPGIEALK